MAPAALMPLGAMVVLCKSCPVVLRDGVFIIVSMGMAVGYIGAPGGVFGMLLPFERVGTWPVCVVVNVWIPGISGSVGIFVVIVYAGRVARAVVGTVLLLLSTRFFPGCQMVGSARVGTSVVFVGVSGVVSIVSVCSWRGFNVLLLRFLSIGKLARVWLRLLG